MKAISSWISAAAVGGVLLLPANAFAQGGPPVWVQERILGQVRGGQVIGRADRTRGSVLDRVVGRGEQINGCAPGLSVAARTPAGPILAAIFGAGGPASHARPGCRGDDEYENEEYEYEGDEYEVERDRGSVRVPVERPRTSPRSSPRDRRGRIGHR